MNGSEPIDPLLRVKKLCQKASEFCIDTKIPVIRYMRTTREMERMALVYAGENEYQNGFVLYMKLITLLVEKLPVHPQYRALNAEEKKKLKKRCETAFIAAEKLKSLLKVEFQKDYELWKEQERLAEEERKRLEEIKRQESKKEESGNRLLQKEISSSTTTAQPVPRSSDTSFGVPPNIALLPPRADSYPNVPSISTSERLQPSAPPADLILPSNSSDVIPSSPLSPLYSINQFNHINSQSSGPYNLPPPPTYQEAVNDVPKVDRSSKPLDIAKPEINRSTKPDDLIFRQESITSLDGNRQVLLSSDLVPMFLQLASSNTTKNLETCGILTGRLAKNAFRITHLIIPKQSATSDSCTTESEEDLFDIQDKHDLITLGWIHTHPSQTSFLSSVDLHTQCSYQQLMPEAIAIVCAPKYKTTGIYRLTPTYGVSFISSCSQPGFHPHPKEPPLYEESPLVSVSNELKTELIDLR